MNVGIIDKVRKKKMKCPLCNMDSVIECIESNECYCQICEIYFQSDE